VQRLFCFCGFPIPSDDQIGQTPLCIAAYHGHEGIVEYLMQAGADIDGKFSDANNYEDNWKVTYW